jgi:hypothetical protein
LAKTIKINIDNDLIHAAEIALAQQPKSVTEQIEKWAYIGKAAARHLTETQLMSLQLDTGTLVFRAKDCNDSD